MYAISALLIGLASSVQALEYKFKVPSQGLEYTIEIPDNKSIKKITLHNVTYYLYDDIDENKPTFSFNEIETLLTDGIKITDLDYERDGRVDERLTSIKTIEIDENTKRIERYHDLDDIDDGPDRVDIEKTFYKDGTKITEIDIYADGRINSILTEKIINGVKITDIDLGALGRVYERRIEKTVDGKKIIEIYPYAGELLERRVVEEKILELDL